MSTAGSKEERQGLLSTSGMSSKKTSKSKKSASPTSVRSLTTVRSSTTVARREMPKMSDGSEFDSGPYGWLFSFAYLFILWGVVISLSVAFIYYLYSQLDPRYPRYFGTGTFAGGTPHITFDPNPRRFTEDMFNRMEFDQYEFRSYVNYLIRYKHVMKGYNDTLPPCWKTPLNENEACGFERVDGFGECAFTRENLEKGMGFSKGQPCIMIKLNKILGWHPNDILTNDDQTCSRGQCCGSGITFNCSSNGDVKFEFYPNQGIQSCYYPFNGQPGYEQPFVMVKLYNLPENKEVKISCSPNPNALKITDGDRPNELHFYIKRRKHVEDTG
ncbi:unnamed protein product [Caenorhabditis auriculariae]|uniref:Uncharacterized protein n=1 Tax=Caenorhabditis auriculariae TaxID=2777116 RepID=A0A8S1HPG4_9PELO|nr:unnamed protein product [Caenorhabditis auriculariae]